MHEHEQFWSLIAEQWEALWRFALGLAGSEDDAKDLVSDTVLAASKSFSSLRSPAAFKSFLFTIALRLHKRRRWRSQIFTTLDKAISIADSHTHESDHDLDLLLQALQKLPDKQREAILLFEISGLSLEEIRVIQGGSLSAVKLRLLRGRDALRHNLLDPSDLARRTTRASTLQPQTT